MNLVWPLVALFGSVVVLWAYFSYGRPVRGSTDKSSTRNTEQPGDNVQTPFPMIVAKGTFHCGAGCTIGDICAEWLAFGVPAVAIWLGWKSIFPEKIFAVWILDYVFAFVIGIAFQYFSIKPMRHLSVGQGLVQALKADSLSLTAWQIGMYGFMALAHFWFFGTLLGARLEVDSVEFWFMMQIGMFAGFATSYPVNWWLIRRGVKEEM